MIEEWWFSRIYSGYYNCKTLWQSFPYRLHNAVQVKQKDKQNISQLEKKLKAEQEARSFVEKQLMEEKKRKKLEEATAARAVAFAAASRYVRVTWVLHLWLAFLVPRQPWKFDASDRIGNTTVVHRWIAFKYGFISWFKLHLCRLALLRQLYPQLIHKGGWGNHHASHTWEAECCPYKGFQSFCSRLIITKC